LMIIVSFVNRILCRLLEAIDFGEQIRFDKRVCKPA
jgi:hypothetical protein